MKLKYIILLILLNPIITKAYDTSASSAVLMDMDSLNVIYSKNMDDIRSVASISNIMTT